MILHRRQNMPRYMPFLRTAIDLMCCKLSKSVTVVLGDVWTLPELVQARFRATLQRDAEEMSACAGMDDYTPLHNENGVAD